MSEVELRALRKLVEDGISSIHDRLDKLEQKVDDGFGDIHQGVHGLMFRFLTLSEVNEIRARMKNAPDMGTMPFYAIR